MQLIQKFYFPWHFPFRKELAGILFILLLFILFPRLVRQVDYTAATIDPGAFSAVILAVSAMLSQHRPNTNTNPYMIAK